MSETQGTTNAIQEMRPLKTVKILPDTETFPYTVTATNITGISIINTGANSITFTITLTDSTEFVFAVPVGSSYEARYEEAIETIAKAGTTPSFYIELLRGTS